MCCILLHFILYVPRKLRRLIRARTKRYYFCVSGLGCHVEGSDAWFAAAGGPGDMCLVSASGCAVTVQIHHVLLEVNPRNLRTVIQLIIH